MSENAGGGIEHGEGNRPSEVRPIFIGFSNLTQTL